MANIINLKSDDHYAFKWSVHLTDDEVSAIHEVNENNRVPFPDQVNKMKVFRSCLGMIHSVASFTLDKSNILTIRSGARSNYESFYKRAIEKFGAKADLSETDDFILKIKDVGFLELKEFFGLLKAEPRLADVDLETEMAFTEFGKLPLSERLKVINFDIETLPDKFFDKIVTEELMDDPVYAVIDKPITVHDLLPEGIIQGKHTYDRKTFKKLHGKCPVSGLPLKATPQPNTRLKYELLEVVRKAEGAAAEQLHPS